MINNFIELGLQKPAPDRYLDGRLIDELKDIKPTSGCENNYHHVVFVEYKIGPESSFFDMKPGICSCGIYWKTLANSDSNELKKYWIKNGKIPSD